MPLYARKSRIAKAAFACHYGRMPKHANKRPRDTNQLSQSLLIESLREDLPTKAQISLLMATLGRKGGRIGGKRRLETMSAKERKEAARKAAQARWKREEKS